MQHNSRARRAPSLRGNHVYKKEGGGGHEGRRAPGLRFRGRPRRPRASRAHAQGAGPASSSRAAGTANRAVDGPGGSAAPPGGGARPCPLPVAGRRRRGPASLHLLTPEAASLRAAASRASRSPLRISLQSPPPTPALTPPFCTPSPFPAAARRSADTESAAGFAEPSGGPGRSIAAPGRGAGPARGASGAVAARTVPLRVPPRPRAARVLPGTPWSRRVPSGHKGARGTMGAASPWAPGARSGDSALRGGGRPSRRALSGQPPYASPPLLPPPPPPRHGCCSHSPVRLLRSRRHRAAGLNRPALTWDTSSVLCRAGPRRVGAPRGG